MDLILNINKIGDFNKMRLRRRILKAEENIQDSKKMSTQELEDFIDEVREICDDSLEYAITREKFKSTVQMFKEYEEDFELEDNISNENMFVFSKLEGLEEQNNLNVIFYILEFEPKSYNEQHQEIGFMTLLIKIK